MYKIITHIIVEEHFDSPEESEDVKAEWKAPLRYYPDGVQIPSGLPISYQIASGNNRCGNCKAYKPANGACSRWLEPVRPGYVCQAWTAIPS